MQFKNYLNFEVTYILEDRQGFYWLAAWDGLYKVSINKAGELHIESHFSHIDGNSKSLISNAVVSVFQDKDGSIWVGTMNGLDMLNEKTKTFEHYQHKEGVANSLPNNDVLTIRQDRYGKIWIGTRGEGLACFDKKQQQFLNYKVEKSKGETLSNNSVKTLFEDKTGVLWIGTLGGGINKIDLNKKQFTKYEISLKNVDQISSNFIRAIYEDKNKLLWIGTLDGGLFTYDRNKNTYTHFAGIETDVENDKETRTLNNFVYGKNIFSIAEPSNNELWICSNGGINILNKKTGRFIYHSKEYNNPDKLISNSVFSIAADDDGSLWVGTWGALHHYVAGNSSQSGHFIRYVNNPNNPNSISNNIIRYVYNDPANHDMWIATMGGGINRLIKNRTVHSVKFIQYKHTNNPLSISSDEVNMILRSKVGDLWIATNDGLNQLVEKQGTANCTFIKYKEKDGLAGNHVQSLLEDSNGNIWIGTNKGLSRFNPITREFDNFDESDGLQSNEFSEHTCFKSSTGEMFFGGIKGFNSFYPDSIKENVSKPTVVITNLSIFNKPVPVGDFVDGRIILTKDISESNEINLSYKDNVFTIEFAALHYASSKKNKYAYKMEGFNDNWLFTDAQNRKATFTNLKGGSYIFKVKASNNDGLWNEDPTTLKITITPPIWLTWQAFVLYFIVLSLLTYLIVADVKTRERLKAEVALKSIEKEKAEELNQLKLQFFTNISHEFRTPLTLIISPLENIINSGKVNAYLKEPLSIMYRNARYLLKLINELMDFRKAETGSMQLQAAKYDLVAFVREICLAFNEIAKDRNIQFEFKTDLKEIEVWFDYEMLVKVLNNLIYNALKFTSDGGNIVISIQQGMGNEDKALTNKYVISENSNPLSDCVSITVKDNGIGISESSIGDIFNRYYQVGSSDSTLHIGSGIGLALTKNLVLYHKGEIFVGSERNVGTEFIVRLPLGERHLSESEKKKDADQAMQQQLEKQDVLLDSYIDYNGEFKNELLSSEYLSKAPVILVVEDNVEMRNFIKSNLEKKFRVIEAENGKDGFSKAIENMPDLIVSDVIMPEMDGIQLCRKLKKDIFTSHIPIILLTALSTVSNQIEGLETGADDYISKPFNYKLFEIRIENLIRSRMKLRERFSKEIEGEPKDFTMNRRDQEFLDKAINLVKEQISEPELSVDNMSQDLGMSRMHLHRKLTALTNQTPSEFIRTIRLKEGAKLLIENNLTVSEIAFKVGFTAPSYFTTCFGKQFGISPKEYFNKYSK